MTAIAQISDIHFGSEVEGAAEALLDELNSESLDLVILSGDLTMAARSDEYEKARAFIDALKAPTLSVPGNHDLTPYNLPERLLVPYRRWRHYVSQEIEPSWSDGTVSIVGLNTARRMRLRLNWSHDSLSHGQIAALGPRFDALGETPFRIVVAHHPFLEEDTLELQDRPRVMVKRSEQALAEFAQENVDLVIAGHLHRTYTAAYRGSTRRRGRKSGAEAVSDHEVTLLQAGTALSGRTRGERNSFNRIEVSDDVLEVHTVILGDDGWLRAPQPLVRIAKH